MLRHRSCNPDLLYLDLESKRVLWFSTHNFTNGEGRRWGEQCTPPPPLRPLKEHYTPMGYASPSCIQLPTMQAAQYEIKPSTINLLPSFYSSNNEDLYSHIDDFPDICSTMRINNFSSEALKVLLVPFSLKDKAKYWLSTLPANSITTWVKLQQKFLDKYFSVGKTNQYRRSITSFTQTDREQFHEV